jgi:septum formation protein
VTVPPHLVLASNSPRRKELLSLTGLAFRVAPSDVDESQRHGEPPGAYVLRLARSKAFSSTKEITGNEILLAADTAVVDGGVILGKPRDSLEARRMLTSLRGHTHRVCTGIALLQGEDKQLVTDLCVTDVPMRPYSSDEIAEYVATGDPLDKAGAYGIQHPTFRPVEKLSGCYASVMGLPLCHLTRSLGRLGVEPAADVAGNCQSALGYSCPIFRAVLAGEGAIPQ